MRWAAMSCCSRVSLMLTSANSAATKNAFAATSRTTATIRSTTKVTMKLKSYHQAAVWQDALWHNRFPTSNLRGVQSTAIVPVPIRSNAMEKCHPGRVFHHRARNFSSYWYVHIIRTECYLASGGGSGQRQK